MDAVRAHRWAGAAALTVMMLSACGTAGGGAGHQAKQVALSFVYTGKDLSVFQEIAYGARAAGADTQGVTLKEAAPDSFDPETEVGLFNTAIKDAMNGYAVVPTVPGIFLAPAKRARSAGLPVVAVDTPLPPGADVQTYVGNSNFELGRQLAQEVVNQIPAGSTGQVVIGDQNPGLPVLEQRLTGMLQVLKQERPSVQIIGPFDSRKDDNLAAWTAEVQRYPNALAYLAPSDM